MTFDVILLAITKLLQN